MFPNVLRPDFIGIQLRFTRDDDSSNAAGNKKIKLIILQILQLIQSRFVTD